MIAKNIFKKKQTKKKFILFYFILLITIIFVIYFYSNKYENGITVIPEYKKKFYIIPKDKGGQKVANLDKKSLNLKLEKKDENNIKNPDNLLFSIQFYSDSNIDKVINFLKKLNDSFEKIYNINDFYILEFTSEIGIEYFLLYKNFENRTDAKNYCLNFMPKIDNCYVVDTTKF
tara:strand:- start:28 stop:549 length:522 start_codon:yes stop_codon:yes gene_type:complete